MGERKTLAERMAETIDDDTLDTIAVAALSPNKEVTIERNTMLALGAAVRVARSVLSAARSTLASSERERDEWKEKCREANRQRSRVWGRAERAEEAASRLAAIEAALRTEQAQHALTKRGHNNAVAWVASLLEDAVRADTADSALSSARERTRVDDEWMRKACESIEGLTAGSFTGHPVVDAVAGLRADLALAREEARTAAERSNRQSEIISAISEALGNRLAPSALALAKSVAAERDAAREEARAAEQRARDAEAERDENEQAHVVEEQRLLREAAASVSREEALREEARRLTEERDAALAQRGNLSLAHDLDAECRARDAAESSERRLRGALEGAAAAMEHQRDVRPGALPEVLTSIAAARAALGSSPVGGDDNTKGETT